MIFISKMKNSLKPIKCRNYELKFDKTVIMGVLNVTPDSFSDGGSFFDYEKAIGHARQMVKDGAQIIDVGGESTRPGSLPISEKEELRRVKPVIRALAREIHIPISIDTYKPKIAEECIKAGAGIVNDISGLADRNMLKILKKYQAPVVVMHMKGKPRTMQKNPQYRDAVSDIKKFLKGKIEKSKKFGIRDIIIDPGIGFGKTTEHNLQIIKRLGEFKELGCPILIGPSRKTFIGKITGLSVNERLEGTLAAIAISAMNGANIARVHDVKECARAIQVADAIRGA